MNAFRRFAAPLVALSALALALACWSGSISGLLDGLNHFAPFWLALSVAAAAACFWLGARKWAALAALAIVAQLAIIAPEFMAQPAARSAPTGGPQVRIVWLNTWLGSRPSEETLRYLEESGADFLLLTEVHDDEQAVFQRLRELYPTLIQCDNGHRHCDTRIYARREPVFTKAPGTLRAAAGEFDIDGAPLHLIAAHMPRPNPPGLQQRALADLAWIVHESEPQNVILAGDFNSTPWSFTLRAFDGASGLRRQTRVLPTWPAQAWSRFRLPAVAPFLPIDHVYSGANWRLVALRRGPRTGSDHYPIEATFEYVSQ